MSTIKTTNANFVYPQSFSSFGPHSSQRQETFVDDDVQQSVASADDVGICVSDAAIFPGSALKMHPTEVEEEVIVSTSVGDDVVQVSQGEVIAETMGEVEVAQDEDLLNALD